MYVAVAARGRVQECIDSVTGNRCVRACVCVGVKFLIAEDYFIDIDHVWPKSQMMLTHFLHCPSRKVVRCFGIRTNQSWKGLMIRFTIN